MFQLDIYNQKLQLNDYLLNIYFFRKKITIKSLVYNEIIVCH
jgi:hypothetical protein